MADSKFLHADVRLHNAEIATVATPYEEMCSARSAFMAAWLQWVETNPGGRLTALESDATASVLRQLAAFHETVGGDDDR